MKTDKDFAAFILTNGRPNKVKTYSTLRRSGYTGKIYLIVDDLDKKKDEYIEKYGDEVIVFDKKAIAKTFDQGDNFNDMRAIIYARNASFEIAKSLDLKYFVQLDDDYVKFDWRFDNNLNYSAHVCRSLDKIFNYILYFLDNSKIDSISIAQGGDFIGGSGNQNAFCPQLTRKCMNSFFCSTERPFKFIGRINEDVNTYTRKASTGLILFTSNQVSLTQTVTQSNSGGMTELYLDSGTYIKSFYSVMYHPSSVKVKLLQSKNKRLHHAIDWKATVPLILRESVKKK
jgi:hypothetical protein